MSEPGDLNKKIEALETHITHQDSIIEELNAVSIKQWVEIRKLNDQFDLLRNKFSELEQGIETPPDIDAPPPHY
jgi:uncharacterized coiled-coil protein SlyX